ncbi:MAG: tetratricopeptide repeat protein [Anaerolineae bacterium]|nr:tetratricopeptide repeat protein [Anaerolineae bacterium]
MQTITSPSNKQHIFVSYAEQDGKEFALKLHDILEAEGFSIWLNIIDIRPSQKWDEAIDVAIKGCWLLIFVMTPESIESEVCHDEWSRALSFKKPVIPIMLRSVLPPLRLHRRQWIDFEGDFDQGLARLRQSLRHLQTVEGELEVLEVRLSDLQDELQSSTEVRREAVAAEMQRLREQITFKKKALLNPSQKREFQKEKLQEAIKRERDSFASSRERDRLAVKTRVVGSAPQGLTEFFRDRINEANKITNILLDTNSDCRVVSIYGKGGVGKSALACAIMSDLERDTDNVMGLVYLSTKSGHTINLESVFLSCVKLFEVEIEERLIKLWTNPRINIRRKVAALIEVFAGLSTRCIVLLDNLEDILNDRGEFTSKDMQDFFELFLVQKHNARILVTSREDISLTSQLKRFEYRFPLEEGLPIDDAVQLLKDFDNDGTLEFDTVDKDCLRQLAEKSHGYPRALEAIVGLLDQDPFLTADALLDNESLFGEHVIEQLVEEAQSRLDSDSRLVMQALAVFDKPVSKEAIIFLLAPFAESIDLESIIKRLARGRFITIKRSSGEITVHPLDQTYNYSQIPVESSHAYNVYAMERRAAEYYSELELPADKWANIADLEPQILGFRHLINANEYDKACELLETIDESLYIWGHYSTQVELREKLIGNVDSMSLHATNLSSLGRICHSLGEYSRAVELYTEALAIARDLQDLQRETIYLGNLGIANHFLGNIEPALESYETALKIARSINDKRHEGIWLGTLGRAYHDMGNIEYAIELREQAIAIAKEIGDREYEGIWYGHLGNAFKYLGDLAKAISLYEQAIEVAEEINDRAHLGVWTGSLGGVYQSLGQIEKALEFHQKAYNLVGETGDKQSVAVWVGLIGIDHLLLGNVTSAKIQFIQALETSREIGDRRSSVIWTNNLGKVELYKQNYDAAISLFTEALNIAQDIGYKVGESYQLIGLARARMKLGDIEKAKQDCVSAQQVKNTDIQHQAILLVGQIALLSNQNESATKLFREIVNDCESMSNSFLLSYGVAYSWAAAVFGIYVSTGDVQYERISLQQYEKAVSLCDASFVKWEALFFLRTFERNGFLINDDLKKLLIN